MTDLRTAAQRPAEPVQEPVAWMTPGQDLHLNNGEGFRFSDWTPLYAAPPQRKPLTEEEIGIICASKKIWGPPQRKPLPASEIVTMYDRHAACQEECPEISGWWDFARAIERAHGIT